MSGGARGRRRRHRARNSRAQNQSAIQVRSTTRSSSIPQDLCDRDVVQAGFAAFSARQGNVAAALLTSLEMDTASPKTLAAESLVHTTEGWRFLASALTALLAHGDMQAIHFAYYAEVRAAVSLLASFGLRVKYPRSAYLETSGSERSPSWRRDRTHELVWALWSDWVQTSAAEEFFLDGLRIHPSVSLRAFRDAIASVSASVNLTAWGRDLRLNNEHTARNRASYEAVQACEGISFMEQADFEFVRDLWALAEPTGVGLQFEAQLVHWMLKKEKHDRELTGPAGAGDEWLDMVLTAVERSTGVPTEELKAALSLDANASTVFDAAFSVDVGAKNITARAFFLLRLSTLAVASAFVAQSGTPGKAWLREWLQHAGLYVPSDEIIPADIWADFEHLVRMQAPALPLPATLIQDASLASDVLKLARPEAVLAWSVPL